MRLLSILLLFIGGLIQAQVTLSSEKLTFGDVLTTSDKEMGVDVSNNSGVDLIIEKIKKNMLKRTWLKRLFFRNRQGRKINGGSRSGA